jgi:hypothetical protein
MNNNISTRVCIKCNEEKMTCDMVFTRNKPTNTCVDCDRKRIKKYSENSWRSKTSDRSLSWKNRKFTLRKKEGKKNG